MLRTGQWLGAAAGSALGILFLVINISEVRNGNQDATVITFALPLLLLAGGAAAGRWCCRWLAVQILRARGFLLMVLNGVVLGPIIGVVLLVTLAVLFYLAQYWLDDLSFTGGVPAILKNGAMLFGFFGMIAGIPLGLALGLCAALATQLSARRECRQGGSSADSLQEARFSNRP